MQNAKKKIPFSDENGNYLFFFRNNSSYEHVNIKKSPNEYEIFVEQY